MHSTPHFTHHEQTPRTPRQVRVPGRDDIGEVVDEGKNFGTNPSIRCLGVYFPETGECAYYETKRVRDAEDQ